MCDPAIKLQQDKAVVKEQSLSHNKNITYRSNTDRKIIMAKNVFTLPSEISVLESFYCESYIYSLWRTSISICLKEYIFLHEA